ncbi:hypothetical protein PIB30_088747 [Stylosanthes scabra]|uniref:Uncharacterized protein n=1 Tax=Stylosanthes scabra TaxID=79078 RepID=A0ABU6QTY7_9FABA|nr:hypothetical protein [Stylosanthes scabra]
MLVQPSKLHKQLANSAKLRAQPLSGVHAMNLACIQGDHATQLVHAQPLLCVRSVKGAQAPFQGCQLVRAQHLCCVRSTLHKTPFPCFLNTPNSFLHSHFIISQLPQLKFTLILSSSYHWHPPTTIIHLHCHHSSSSSPPREESSPNPSDKSFCQIGNTQSPDITNTTTNIIDSNNVSPAVKKPIFIDLTKDSESEGRSKEENPERKLANTLRKMIGLRELDSDDSDLGFPYSTSSSSEEDDMLKNDP